MAKREVGVLEPERRRALLESAAAEFARAGYERASLNRVIGAQGMSKSSFYHYFASKEALFQAVVADLGTALAEALDLPSPEELAADFWPGVERLARRLGEVGAERPGFRDLAALFYLPDAPDAIAASRARVDDWIDAALKAGREAGAVAADLPLSLQRHLVRAVLWAMDEWSVANPEGMDEAELRRLAGLQMTALQGMLAPRA